LNYPILKPGHLPVPSRKHLVVDVNHCIIALVTFAKVGNSVSGQIQYKNVRSNSSAHGFVYKVKDSVQFPYLSRSKHNYSVNTLPGIWRWALLSPDGVAPSWMVCVSASVNLSLHHKVQKFFFWHRLIQVVLEKGP